MRTNNMITWFFVSIILPLFKEDKICPYLKFSISFLNGCFLISAMNFKDFYFKNYRTLMIIPLIIFILSFIIVGVTINKTGDFIEKDVSLKGGTSITIYTDKEYELEDFLSKKFNKEFIVRKITEFGTNQQKGIIVEGEVKSKELKEALEGKLGFKLTDLNSSIEETAPSFGKSFYSQLLSAILIAFVLMAIVVFLVFRNLVPSLAVILSAIFDLVVTVAILNLIGVKISTAGIAALLLVLGYSIDTDLLLTTRLLKRKEGSLKERILGSIKTGLTMTVTTVVALTIGYFVSSSMVLKQMFLIIIIALLVDVISTWIMNTGILRWYLSRKNG